MNLYPLISPRSCKACSCDISPKGRAMYCPPCRELKRKEKVKGKRRENCIACDRGIEGRKHNAIYCLSCANDASAPKTRKRGQCKRCECSLSDRRRTFCVACKKAERIEREARINRTILCASCDCKIIGRANNAQFCVDCAGKRARQKSPAQLGEVRNDNEISRKVTKFAVLHGFLSHPSSFKCVDCKRVQAECYDHRDYNDPLNVDPVCLRCNSSRGAGIPFFSPLRKKGI